MNRPALPFENTYLDALRQGDRDAFTRIYEHYWHPLYQTAYSRLKDREAAEEIVQELFIGLWERRETLRIDKLENYLFRAVQYAIIDAVRRELSQNKRLEFYQLFLQTEQQGEEDDLYETALQKLGNGLEQLPEKTRQIFVLYRLKGWSIERLSRHFDLSDKAIEYHLTKSHHLLRIYLRDAIYCGLFIPFQQDTFFYL